MAVEEHRLHPGKQRITAIEMSPSRLDHPDFRIGEKMDRPFKQVGLRNEVRVENANELALGRGQPSLEGAGLEPGAIGSLDQLDIETAPQKLGDAGSRQLLRVVRRIVQDLDLQFVLRIIDLRD